MLHVDDVHAYYGDSHVLKGMTFHVSRGQVATLLGRNGAGKTTTLRTIMGLVHADRGAIEIRGEKVTHYKPHSIANLGVGYVPEERAIFASLTVLENLTLPAPKKGTGLWPLEKVYDHFPVLKIRGHHRGSQLSGGEQQMLAIARVLTMNIELILMDEPTEGLAPLLVREIAGIMAKLKEEGVTILLVEQNTRFAVQLADHHFVIYDGKIAYSASNEEFRVDDEVKSRYLGV